MKKTVWSIVISMLLLAVIATACSQPAPSPSPTPTPKPTTSPTATAAAKKIPWRIFAVGVSRGFTKGMEFWASEMAKRTNLDPQIFWGGVLGASGDMPDGVKDGLYEMAMAQSVLHPSKTPLNVVAELPFLAPPNAVAIAYWQEWMEQQSIITDFMRDKWNILELEPAVVGPYQIVSTKPLRTVDDFKGLRVRAPGTIGNVLQKFGAVPTMVPAPDTYSLMQKGSVDAAILTWDSLTAYKLQEVAKYVVKMDFSTTGNALLVNYKTWQAMPPEVKQAAKDIHQQYMKVMTEAVDNGDRDASKLLQSKLEYSVFPKAEKDKLIAASGDEYTKWVNSMEKDYGIKGAQAFLDQVKQKAAEMGTKYPTTW